MIDYHNSSLVRDERNLNQDTFYDQRRGQSFGFIGKKRQTLLMGSQNTLTFYRFLCAMGTGAIRSPEPVLSYDLLRTSRSYFFLK